MNLTRLAVAFKAARAVPDLDLSDFHHDFAHVVAEVACGEKLGSRTVVKYRGVEMHVEDVAILFLESNDREAEALFYPGRFPEKAYRLFRAKRHIEALQYAVSAYFPRS